MASAGRRFSRTRGQGIVTSTGVHQAQCERIVAAIVATMPPAAGELIRLIDVEERSLPDAAAIVGRGVALVQKQHERALRKFEELALQYFCSPPGFAW